MTQEQQGENAWKNGGWWFLRSAFAAAVTYAFVIILLVATAQQKVDDALAKEKVGYDYSVAIRYFLGSDDMTERAKKNSDDIRKAMASLRTANRDVQTAERGLGVQAARLRQVVGGLASTCGVQGVSPSATPQELVAAAWSVQDCVASLPEPNPGAVGLRGQAEQLQARVETALDNVTDAKNKVEDQEASLKLLQAERDNTQNQIAAAARSTPLLEILRIFENSWWLLGIPFIRMPPVLTGIILASISGMFGALIITLVLFVYPDSKFTKSASYFGRIFLGGVIALGVFVIMFSGVAVFAGPEGTGSAQNLMAYSAVGLLAGMFSDQAADWLSKRDVFKSGAGGGGDKDTPGKTGRDGDSRRDGDSH